LFSFKINPLTKQVFMIHDKSGLQHSGQGPMESADVDSY